MTKFQYTHNSADIDVAHLTMDETFDLTLLRRETGIDIGVLIDDGYTCLGSMYIGDPAGQEV